MSIKRALITGITGQDAAYLSALLLGDGYEVFGSYRPASNRDFWRLDALGIRNHPSLRLLEFEASDVAVCRDLVGSTGVSEIYNLGGQSSAVASVAAPVETAEANGMGALYLLEAIRAVSPSARFFQAGSAELFGRPRVAPQTETTPFHPTNPYGVAKLFAHWATVNYREAYGVFASSGILFNHESPLRGETFVTRKITRGLARIAEGLEQCLFLGNLDSLRDWGHARDYVRAQWLMLQQDTAEDFVIATGEQHSVREFAERAAQLLGMRLEWTGTGIEERGVDAKSGRTIVRIDARYFRPTEVETLLGDASKALHKLGWKPETDFQTLIAEMVKEDLELARRDAVMTREGFKTYQYRE